MVVCGPSKTKTSSADFCFVWGEGSRGLADGGVWTFQKSNLRNLGIYPYNPVYSVYSGTGLLAYNLVLTVVCTVRVPARAI